MSDVARRAKSERSAKNAARLQRNAGLNDLPIHVVEAAAWNETGTVELVAGDSAKEFRTVAGTGVQSIALDDLAERERPPALIKLDVEGAEGRVLKGARRLLAETRPTIICELHNEQARADVLALLAEYRVVELDGPSRIVATRAVGA